MMVRMHVNIWSAEPIPAAVLETLPELSVASGVLSGELAGRDELDCLLARLRAASVRVLSVEVAP
jgi:hypothetical protein